MNERKSIDLEGLSHPGFPIPAASRVGPIIMTGGVRGVDWATGQMPGDVAGQVTLMFDNVIALVEAAGASKQRIVKITLWVTDRSALEAINTEWLKHFPDPQSRPARHLLTYDLPGGMLVQCDAVAVAD